MWTYRRVLRISWKEKVTNKEVLETMSLNNTELLKSIKKKKLSYFGNTKRHESLQKLILEGKVDGSRGRGRRRKSWTTNIAEWEETREASGQQEIFRGRTPLKQVFRPLLPYTLRGPGDTQVMTPKCFAAVFFIWRWQGSNPRGLRHLWIFRSCMFV